jgi:hypothetical protein
MSAPHPSVQGRGVALLPPAHARGMDYSWRCIAHLDS